MLALGMPSALLCAARSFWIVPEPGAALDGAPIPSQRWTQEST